MWLIRLMRSFAIALNLAWILLATAHAEESSASREAMKVVVEKASTNTTLPLFRAWITSGTDKFTFLVPEGFYIRAAPSQDRLKLANKAGDCQIAFALLHITPSDTGELKPEICRELLLSRHPGAKVLEEFPEHAAGQEGLGYDLQWETPEHLAYRIRTVFVPFASGVWEFTTTTVPKKFPEGRAGLHTLILTFRASAGGVLEVRPLPDRL